MDGNSGVGWSPGDLFPTEPGPGGFRGGATGPQGSSSGYGPGGKYSGDRGGASYTGAYGNPLLLPLIGGSGANAGVFGNNNTVISGASGGGAILITAAGDVNITGSLTANGKSTVYYSYGDPSYISSSGGAIRIVANRLLGNGSISADRVRVEANNTSEQINLNPNTSAVPPGVTPIIWPSVASPIVKVVSVNSQSAPNDPHAGLITSSDVNIGTNGVVDVILATSNFPPSGAVSLRVIPKYGAYYNVDASFVSGTFSNATWKATTTLPNGFCVLQAHATSP